MKIKKELFKTTVVAVFIFAIMIIAIIFCGGCGNKDFYKLYKIHRRTDIRNFMRDADERLRPEYYNLKSERAKSAPARFMAAGALISSMDINSIYPEM